MIPSDIEKNTFSTVYLLHRARLLSFILYTIYRENILDYSGNAFMAIFLNDLEFGVQALRV